MFNGHRPPVGLPVAAPLIAIFVMAGAAAFAAERQDGGTAPEGTVIRLLDRASTVGFEDYHPAYVIEAVNALQPLGKDRALAQIDSYLEGRDQSSYPDGLFWVLRVLFDVPAEQGFPTAYIGRPSIPPPAEPGKLPRFPVVMVRDIPFLAVRGYILQGFPQPVEEHVAYFRDHGVLRERPLAPPASMDGIAEAFMQRWTAAYGDAFAAEALATIEEQIARLEGS